MFPKKITIGICLRTVSKTVSTAIQSISFQNYPHNLMNLVIVCEENSKETLDWLRSSVENIDVKTTILSSGGKGLGFSRQMVVENAEGAYLVWVDDDFILQEDFVSKHVEFMERNPNVGAAKAKEIPNNKTLVTRLGLYLPLIDKLNSKAPLTGGYEIFRLYALNQVGGYDKKIKGAGEDLDVSLRIKNLGWQLLRNDNSIFSRWDSPATWKALWFKCYWYGYGNRFLRKKYRAKQIHWEFFPLAGFFIGLRNSRIVYKAERNKDVFFLAPYDFFRSVAMLNGFLNAKKDG